MSTYSVNYDEGGRPLSLQTETSSIPLDPQNRDFRIFLEWNAAQAEPIDWQSEQAVPAISTPVIQIKPSDLEGKAYASLSDAERTTLIQAALIQLGLLAADGTVIGGQSAA